MATIYTHTTLSQFREKLLQRLGTPLVSFYEIAELNLYINEALRAFNAGAQFQRTRITWETVQGVTIYDFGAIVPTGGDTSITNRTFLASSLIPVLKYQLMESQTNGVWSEQFTPEAVTDSMNAGQNQFQLDTGMILSNNPTLAVPELSSGRVALSDSCIDVRRAVWIEESETEPHTNLWRNDEYQINALNINSFFDANTPQEYSVATITNTEMQLYPPPITSGFLDVILVESGTTLDPDNPSSTLNMVNDFSDGLKWKILADLLGQDGPGKDPSRAAYCLSRYNDYTTMGKVWPTVIQAFIDNRPVFVQSLFDFDIFNPTWQEGAFTGQPTEIGITNNLIGIAPIPDGRYGITMDVICNAPLPTTDDDFIQIPLEALEDTIGYAAHIAMFKLESPEFDMSMPLYKNFIQMCLTYNSKLQADDFELLVDRGTTQEQERQVARRK